MRKVTYNALGVPRSNATIIAGGGGAAYLPDAVPETPDVADDEFDVGSSIDTAGTRAPSATAWAWINQSTATANLSQEMLKLALPSSGSVEYRGVQQVCSGSWKYRCKMSGARSLVAGNYQLMGMYVYNTGNSKFVSFGFYSPVSAPPSVRLQALRWDSVTSYAGSIYDPGQIDFAWPWQPLYLEIESDGTTLTFRYSFTGYDHTFVQFTTETIATHLSAANRIGLGAFTSNSNAMTVGYEWFRRIA